jgi:hypothetical protein
MSRSCTRSIRCAWRSSEAACRAALKHGADPLLRAKREHTYKVGRMDTIDRYRDLALRDVYFWYLQQRDVYFWHDRYRDLAPVPVAQSYDGNLEERARVDPEAAFAERVVVTAHVQAH